MRLSGTRLQSQQQIGDVKLGHTKGLRKSCNAAEAADSQQSGSSAPYFMNHSTVAVSLEVLLRRGTHIQMHRCDWWL